MTDTRPAEAAPAPSPTDADLVTASLSDPPRFAELFDRHYEAVHRYAQQRVGASAADEVASETFLQAFDRRSRFDAAAGDARPWLLGIATNLLRRHWRTERRRLAAYTRSATAREPGAPAPRALAEETVTALRRLRRQEREPLLLYAWGDLSYEEIARALDVPVGTVRSRISRARARLRRSLAPAPTPTLISEEAPHV